MYACVPVCMPDVLGGQRRVSGTRVRVIVSSHASPSPLQDQEVLLTAKPSFDGYFQKSTFQIIIIVF